MTNEINNKSRSAITALVISSATLIGIAVNEGYVGKAYQDVIGVWTIGFGETKGVKPSDTTTPTRALIKLQDSIDVHAKGMVNCIGNVPLYQYEYDAYVSFTYNVGIGNFCRSSIPAKLAKGDYKGACETILLFRRAGQYDCFAPENEKICGGIKRRRYEEYGKCIGE